MRVGCPGEGDEGGYGVIPLSTRISWILTESLNPYNLGGEYNKGSNEYKQLSWQKVHRPGGLSPPSPHQEDEGDLRDETSLSWAIPCPHGRIQ